MLYEVQFNWIDNDNERSSIDQYIDFTRSFSILGAKCPLGANVGVVLDSLRYNFNWNTNIIAKLCRSPRFNDLIQIGTESSLVFKPLTGVNLASLVATFVSYSIL